MADARVEARADERSKSPRMGELDILRFLAALSVVVFHYLPRLSTSQWLTQLASVRCVARYGYLGVDLFFVISGYVIVMSAESRDARSFLIHRALRLFPSFWIALALTLSALFLLKPTGDLPSAATIIANLTMLPGWLGHTRIDDVYWTLAVEWKFYILMTGLLFVKCQKQFEAIAMLWVALLVVQHLGVSQPILRSVTIFPYGSYFAAGMLLYFVRRRGSAAVRIAALTIACALSIRSAIQVMPQFIPIPASHDAWIVGAVVSAIFVIYYLIASGRISLSPAPTLQLLGSVTFPLYLLHNRLGLTLLERLGEHVSEAGALLTVAFVVGGLSVLLAKNVEQAFVPWSAKTRFIRWAGGTRETVPRS